MGLMLSRPGGLSLRSTRVTVATIGLSIAVALTVGLPGIALAVYAVFGRNWLLVPLGLLGVVLGIGAASLALIGILQRVPSSSRTT